MRLTERIMRAVMNDQVHQIVERWPVATLTELRAAIDDAIEIAHEADVTDLELAPLEVHLRRSLGKRGILSVSIAKCSEDNDGDLRHD